jgi:CubicO group peptidase (beta-lactamase class C family)
MRLLLLLPLTLTLAAALMSPQPPRTVVRGAGGHQTYEQLMSSPRDALPKGVSPQDLLRDYMKGVMSCPQTADGPITALSASVTIAGELVFLDAVGLRDTVQNLDATNQTLFGIGSTTKAFTAMLVSMMVEEGRLKWTDHVADHLPGFALYDEFANARATVIDLLAHRVGVPRCGLCCPCDALHHTVPARDAALDTAHFILSCVAVACVRPAIVAGRNQSHDLMIVS